ncbi:hypothetical protein M5689_020722 [Euphorbia peplus]|nr:hypothetical protein M5689_020722 [Euphorbia peplus]
MWRKRREITSESPHPKIYKVQETREDKIVIQRQRRSSKTENKVVLHEKPPIQPNNPERLDSMPLLQGMFVDFDSLSRVKFDISEWVDALNLRKLLSVGEPTYDKLVREFYKNLSTNALYNELHSSVRNVQITVNCQLFEILFGLKDVPDGFCVKSPSVIPQFKGFDDKSFCSSILEKDSLPFSVANFKALAKFMHMVIIKNLLPKFGSRDTSSIAERIVMWHMFNKKPMNFAQQIIYNILYKHSAGIHNKAENVHLPHGGLLIVIFKHFKVPMTVNDKTSMCSQSIDAKYWLRMANFTARRGWILVNFVDVGRDGVIFDSSHVIDEEKENVEEDDTDEDTEYDDGVQDNVVKALVVTGNENDQTGSDGGMAVTASEENQMTARGVVYDNGQIDIYGGIAETDMETENQLVVFDNCHSAIDVDESMVDLEREQNQTENHNATDDAESMVELDREQNQTENLMPESAPEVDREQNQLLGNENAYTSSEVDRTKVEPAQEEIRTQIDIHAADILVELARGENQTETLMLETAPEVDREQTRLQGNENAHTSSLVDQSKVWPAQGENQTSTDTVSVQFQPDDGVIQFGEDTSVEQSDRVLSGVDGIAQHNVTENEIDLEKADPTCKHSIELTGQTPSIKKLIIFYLNGLLVGFDKRVARPHSFVFLQFCLDHFEVGIWSSQMKLDY